jgi:hypothetical protein
VYLCRPRRQTRTMATFKIDLVCPWCGGAANYHEEVPGQPAATPFDDGAYVMCIYCEGLSAFVNSPLGLALRAATAEEQERAEREPRIAMIRETARKMREDGR